MEQTTEPDQNHEIHADENPQQISKNNQYTQKLQKEPNNPSDNDTQKTPENSQNPLARRTHKYPW